MLKLPSPLEVVVLSFPVSVLVSAIVAPGMTPSGPETVPTSVPVFDCARAEAASTQTSSTARVNFFIYDLLQILIVARFRRARRGSDSTSRRGRCPRAAERRARFSLQYGTIDLATDMPWVVSA